MYSMLHRLEEQVPLLILLNLAISGTFCVFATTQFMGIPFTPILALTCMGIIFGIYSLNRFTDLHEDFINDTGRNTLVRHQRGLMLLSGGALLGSILYLLVDRKLTFYYFILLGVGISYSVPLVPWYQRNKGFMFIKLKKIPVVKNMTVAIFWALSIFFVPMFFSGAHVAIHFHFVMALISIMIATLSNTTFNDIRDEPGDRLAGNLTLPVIWGSRPTLQLILSLNAAWITSILILLYIGKIAHPLFGLFLIGMSGYTLVYVAAYYRKWVPGKVTELISDFHFTLYATGLLLTTYPGM